MSGTRWAAAICFLSLATWTASAQQWTVSVSQISSLRQETHNLRLQLSQTQKKIDSISSESESLKVSLSRQRGLVTGLWSSLKMQRETSAERLRLLEESKQLLMRSKEDIQTALQQHRRDLWKARLTWLLAGAVLGFGLAHV